MQVCYFCNKRFLSTSLCLYTQTFQQESWILVFNLIIKHVKGVTSKLTSNSLFTISTTNWEAQWGMYEYLPIHWALPQTLFCTLCCWPFGRRIFCFGRPPSPPNPNSPTLACHLQKFVILSLEKMRKGRLWSSAPNSTHLWYERRWSWSLGLLLQLWLHYKAHQQVLHCLSLQHPHH